MRTITLSETDATAFLRLAARVAEDPCGDHPVDRAMCDAMAHLVLGIEGIPVVETPETVKVFKEVLPETDPRHVKNGGSSAPTPVNVKVVNAIDAGDVVQQGLNTPAGETAIMNFIQANKGKVKSVLG